MTHQTPFDHAAPVRVIDMRKAFKCAAMLFAPVLLVIVGLLAVIP